MSRSISTRYLAIVASSLLALGVAACDEGSEKGSTDNGAGGAGNAGSSSTTASGNPSGTGGGTPSLKVAIIDDMEDQDGSIAASDGRVGAWYTYNDMTAAATQKPTVGDPFMMAAPTKPREGSSYAANTTGSGFADWGAGFGFDLNNDGVAEKKAYDASKYTGITFWAMAGAGSNTVVRLNIGDDQTTPEAGKCDNANGKCSDDFGASLTLTGDWKQYTLYFKDLTAVNWSKQGLKAINPAALYSVHFQVGNAMPFDIWVDDIGFIEP